MSYSIKVYCRSNKVLTRQQLIGFITEGEYFDEDLHFEAPDYQEEEDWGHFLVFFDSKKRPIRFERNALDKLHHEEVAELLFVLELSVRSKARDKVYDHLQQSLQIYAIEFVTEEMTEECWRMIDSVESYIAKALIGIIYAPDEGFYDQDLKRTYRL